MNLLMTGMVAAMIILRSQLGRGADPTTAAFWFVMLMALLVGAILAYPMNWWLVRYHLKHGMTTIRPATGATVAASSVQDGHVTHTGMAEMSSGMAAMAMGATKPRPPVPVMALFSFFALATGLVVTSSVAPM
jgi:Domain of unknown function (DUF4396)